MLRWGNNLDGQYSVKFNNQLMSSNKAPTYQWPGKLVWKVKMPPEISASCRLTLRTTVELSQDNLKRRKFHLGIRCTCLKSLESVNHLTLPCCFRYLVYVPIPLWPTVGYAL